ncbi:MAG: HAMP domain-containing histidine kinase [Lachnospiraceae bacterium]|nr:HAMP domain-containing histidine kinase [Lachnospiraceae bacterium]
MATKWKNTENGKEWMEKLLKREELPLLFGLCCMIPALLLFDDILHGKWFATERTLREGGAMNLFLGLGIWRMLSFVLHFRNRRWNTGHDRFYQEWKQKLKKQQIWFGAAEMAALCAALINFKYIYEHSWKYANYSTGYALVITVLVQGIVCEVVLLSYMKKKLEEYMEALEQINRKNLEAALRSEQMKVDLISNVSHDLKTPLTSMVGYIELIKKEELTDVLSDYVEVLSRKAQKLKEMIDSLFDLAKTSSGNVDLNMEPLEMNRLIEQVYADMEDRILQSGRELVVSLAKEDTGFTADSGYMYRICQNLLENALKYSQEYTRIFLKTLVLSDQVGQQKVRFEITNTAGYRMEFTKEQIVERFARGDESRTTDGNGLGLAIVNTYTAALGGTFDVNIDCDQFKAAVEFLK